MNKRLVCALIWAGASVLAAIQVSTSDMAPVWSLTTILAAWNAIKQFKLYQEEKDDG
jgi:hypothetical protein